MREGVGGSEPELRRTPRTPRHISARARRFELLDNRVCEIRTTDERGPKCRELVNLDPRMRAYSIPVCEEPINTAAPIPAVKVDFACKTLDRVAPACFVSDP
jgi:hypothetical protein